MGGEVAALDVKSMGLLVLDPPISESWGRYVTFFSQDPAKQTNEYSFFSSYKQASCLTFNMWS